MKKFLIVFNIFFYFLLPNLYSGLRDYAAQKNFYIGPAVTNNPLRNETQYRNTIISEFNQMVGENEFKMYIWTGPYSYNFTTTDYYVNFAQQNNIRLRGHCLVWYQVVPDWLRNGNYSSDQVRAMLEAYIKAVVSRYKGKIAEWDVVNEAVSDSSPYGYRSDDFWYQKLGDYIPLAFQWAHEADPDCKLYYNDYGAEGMGGKADAVYNLVSRLKSQGVPIHGVGWQSHWGYNSFLGDNNYENLQRLVALGLDVEVTELDLAIDNPDSSKLAIQAHNYANFTFFCMTHPKVKRMMMWGFTDKYTWLGSEKAPLIFDTNYNKKPAYYAIEAVLKMQPSGGIYNGGFEDNVYCWVPVGNVNISENTSVYRSGTRSALVSNRTQPYQGIGQHVLWYLLEKGTGTYQASCFMRLASGTDQGKITLFIRDDSGNRYITLASGNINNSNFSQVSGQATITWSGLLRVARLYIETQNSSSNFYVDDFTFSKVEQAPPQQYSLTVNINPQGAGSVTLNPSGGVYVAGTTVTLTAVANSGYVFSSWSGSLTGSQNPARIVMNSNKTVTANFVQQSTTTQQPQRYTLTIDINPQFGGRVELNPQGGEYVEGTTVTITAVANSGYVFSGWGGDLSGDQNPVNIVMDSNKNVMVNFIEISSGVVGGTTGYIMIDISSRVISGVVGIVVRLEGYNVSEVSKVRLYLNGILIGEDVDGLDGYVFSLDSRGYGDGVYILKVEVVGLGGVVLGERDEEVEIKNVGGGVGGGNGEGGGSGGSSGEVSSGEISSQANKLYINLTNKHTETIVVDKTEVEWIKVYDLKGKLIDSYDGNTLDVKRYKVGSYIFELKLKDGRTKYGTMVVVK